jgi:hypothetical protein
MQYKHTNKFWIYNVQNVYLNVMVTGAVIDAKNFLSEALRDRIHHG